MKDKDRVRYPHNHNEGWWYEEKWGISVYRNHDSKPLKILWKTLETALKRKKKLFGQ